MYDISCSVAAFAVRSQELWTSKFILHYLLAFSQQNDDHSDRHENREKSRHASLSNNHHTHHHHHRSSRDKQVPSPKAAPSPTLAELNTITDGPRTKRAAYISPYSPSPPPISAGYHYSGASVSDSSSLSPRMAFSEREGFDDLSASFRSLYRSIFGQQPVHHSPNDYFADISSGHNVVPNINTSSGDIGLSNSSSSLPLGASASALFSSLRNPQFMSLMDSFRDIADSNSWDKLDPAQIQGLMDSFKMGEHDKFGLNQEMYAELHTSFNQFLSQLNNRFLTGSSNTSPQLSEYNQYNHNSPVMSHGAGMAGVGRVDGRGLTPKYHAHHQLDMVSPLVTMHQALPPSSSAVGGGRGGGVYTGGDAPHQQKNRTPSPPHQHQQHTSPTQRQHSNNPQGQLATLPTGANPSAHINHQYGGGGGGGVFVSTNHTSLLTSVSPSSGNHTETVPKIESAATDLFEDDDDFDWSRLM